jgi:predicted RNase H-like HicB family nuclease
MPAIRRKFTVILELEEDGGYSVHCPALPGCVSQGDTRQEALENIKEAIQLVLETLKIEEMAVGLGSAELSGESSPPYSESPEAILKEIMYILKDRQQEGLPLTIETVEVELPAQVPA